MTSVRREKREPNPPAVERICVSLWTVIDSCSELLKDHGDGCDCDYCHDVYWLLVTSRLAESMISSQLIPFPAMSRRFAKEREAENTATKLTSSRRSAV
jgi:hypothetical protein